MNNAKTFMFMECTENVTEKKKNFSKLNPNAAIVSIN